MLSDRAEDRPRYLLRMWERGEAQGLAISSPMYYYSAGRRTGAPPYTPKHIHIGGKVPKMRQESRSWIDTRYFSLNDADESETVMQMTALWIHPRNYDLRRRRRSWNHLRHARDGFGYIRVTRGQS